jgi:DNA replication protein DnaD
MSFVSFSSQKVLENTTTVSNKFIEEYLPHCNGDCARVYLYGLFLCSAATTLDNSIEKFAMNLNLGIEDVKSAFAYWQEQGLVHVLSTEPVEVKYLPVRSGGAKLKKHKAGKYDDFNATVNAIIEGRMPTPTELEEYYSLIEVHHIEPAALVMIIKYCQDMKGKNVGYPYIVTVAKNWAYSGIRTMDAVREKLETETGDAESVLKILKAMGSKRTPESLDYDYFSKWTRKLGYSTDTIVAVAKKVKGSMPSLDARLLRYFELKLFETAEINKYEENKHSLIALAREINKKIGVYYENVENVVETYISSWLLKGFDNATLLEVANFCFKSGIRSLEGMNNVINNFYKQGITSSGSIDDFIAKKISDDKEVKGVLGLLGLKREPNASDRDFYQMWRGAWSFSQDVINYAATLGKDKTSPMAYMNKILSSFYEQKITTVEGAKTAAKNVTASTEQKQFTRHSYSDRDLNRLFSNLDEVKL